MQAKTFIQRAKILAGRINKTKKLQASVYEYGYDALICVERKYSYSEPMILEMVKWDQQRKKYEVLKKMTGVIRKYERAV